MQIETAADRLEFFNPKDFGDQCDLLGPDGFALTIFVMLNALTNSVGVFDTNIEAAGENFICRAEDLAAIDEKRLKLYSATIRGHVYQLRRISTDQEQLDGHIRTVYLKK